MYNDYQSHQDVTEEGKRKLEELWDETKGKQIDGVLPMELAGTTFALFMELLEERPALNHWSDDLQNLIAMAAYAGIRYEQERKDK